MAARVVLNVSLVGAVEPLERDEQPGDTALHKAELRIRETIEHAVKEDASEVEEQSMRMPHPADWRVDVHLVEAHAAVRATVHAERTAEAIRLSVDRPVLLRPQVVLQPGRGQHRAAEAELLDGPPQLDHGRLGLLHRDERHTLESVALREVSLVQPV